MVKTRRRIETVYGKIWINNEFACTNDEETRVWDMGEANNADLVTEFLNDEEVINMRTEAGVDLESSEVLSMISKHKIW